jgi:hypothetical protein
MVSLTAHPNEAQSKETEIKALEVKNHRFCDLIHIMGIEKLQDLDERIHITSPQLVVASASLSASWRIPAASRWNSAWSAGPG